MRKSNLIFLLLLMQFALSCSAPAPIIAPTQTPWIVIATPIPGSLPPPTGSTPQTGDLQISFTADRINLNVGDCATLQWNVQGRGSFGQSLDGQPVNNAGQKQVCPRETTRYSLGVDIGTTVINREVVITVAGSALPPPMLTPYGQVQITFSADRTTLQPGECAILQWIAQGVIEFVDLEGQRVAPMGQKQICPAQTTTYTLVVASGTLLSRQVTIVVASGGSLITPTHTPLAPTSSAPGCAGPPVIAFFNANPFQISIGQTSALSWGAVTNATSVTIDRGIGGVATPGSTTVKPASTTTYTLTAIGCGGTVTRQVTVQVSPTLIITPLPVITPGGGGMTSTVLTRTPIVVHVIQADLQVTDIFPETLPQGKIFFRVTNHGPDALTNVSVTFTCSEEHQSIGGGAIQSSGSTGAIVINLNAGQTGAYDSKIAINTNQFKYYIVCTVTSMLDPKSANNSYSEKIPP